MEHVAAPELDIFLGEVGGDQNLSLKIKCHTDIIIFIFMTPNRPSCLYFKSPASAAAFQFNTILCFVANNVTLILGIHQNGTILIPFTLLFLPSLYKQNHFSPRSIFLEFFLI